MSQSQTQVLSTVAFYMSLLFNHAETLQYSPYQNPNHSPNSRYHTSFSERYNFQILALRSKNKQMNLRSMCLFEIIAPELTVGVV